MNKQELVCDYCGKTEKGDEHHFGLPAGWHVVGFHCQTFADHADWRVTHHYCSWKCMEASVLARVGAHIGSRYEEVSDNIC